MSVRKKPKTAKQRQEFADALYYLKTMLLNEKCITDKVSLKISSRSELMGKEMYRRVMDMYDEMVFETEVSLVFEHELEEDNERMNCTSSKTSLQEKKGRITNEKIPYAVKYKAVKLSELHPEWSLTTLRKNSTNLLNSESQLAQWKIDVKKGGSRFDKLKVIGQNVYDRYLKAKEENLDPGKLDGLIKEWALNEASWFENEKFTFKASDGWIRNFKAIHGIS